ncbi:Sucrase/ferredoxin-like-domain-containing protein [Trametes gibbosa]|nr:Sucrase/ferredoxin-like-domain-containing protein [Trametes gibbosa]
MLTLAPAILACRRAPSRLIHDGHYTLVRPFSASPAQRHSDPAARRIPAGLAGTAPYHTAYILLHTHLRPAGYPARSRSPLWRALTIRARRWGAVVNFAWAPALRVHPGYAGLGERARPGEEEEEEVYAASVFSRAHRDRRLEIPEVSLANLDDVDAHLRGVVLGGAPGDGHTALREAGEVLDRRLHVYVCTHGGRDCRCGEGGGAVVRAFERELAKRGIGAEDAVLGELAHVGGHKYAANVLVYPYGDWLGNVQEFDVPRVLDRILDAHREDHHARAEARERPPLCPPFWRGRMGLDKDEQLALLARPAT